MSWYVHMFLIYPLAGIGVVTLGIVAFIFSPLSTPRDDGGCSTCGRAFGTSGTTTREGARRSLQGFRVCAHCAASVPQEAAK